MTNGSPAEIVDELLDAEGPPAIVSAGDPVLRRPLPPYDGELGPERFDRLVHAMRESLHAAPGVGLAAPQIGVPLRIAVIEDRAEVPDDVRSARHRLPQPFRVLVNPSYEDAGRGPAAFFEGCLSVPGLAAVTVRHFAVRLRCSDERGRALDEEVTGWPARIVQHETDHLDGRLYLDVAETRSLSTIQNLTALWASPTPAAAARELGFELPGGGGDRAT
jgi:peptide deformylase